MKRQLRLFRTFWFHFDTIMTLIREKKIKFNNVELRVGRTLWENLNIRNIKNERPTSVISYIQFQLV